MIKKIFLLLTMTLFLCGCVKVETDLTINNDGSAVVKERFLMSKQLLAMSAQDPFEQTIKEKQAQNRDVKLYETEEMKGIEATKNIKNIDNDEWNTTPENDAIKSNNADKKFVSVKKGVFTTTYNIDAEFNMSKNSNDSTNTAQLEEMKANGMDINNFVQIKYSIHTPKKADSHNATSVDTTTNTYTWNIKIDEVSKMQIQFTTYNTINIAISAIIILLALVGLFSIYLNKQN